MADEKFYGYAGSGRPMDEAMQVQRLVELIGQVTLGAPVPEWDKAIAAAILDSDVIREINAGAWADGWDHCYHGGSHANPYREAPDGT